MCVENIYIDVYPDGRQVEFRQTSICQYGQPDHPCHTLTTLTNPPRHINYGEITARDMLTQSAFYPRNPQTPPRSPAGSQHCRSSSLHRLSGGYLSDGSPVRRVRRESGVTAVLNGKKLRQHRKERIVIVDSPPTPRTPPQVFSQVFTAPSSPATPPFIFDTTTIRGRPIIVDERPFRRERAPSVGAVVGERLRARSQSRLRHLSPASTTAIDRIALRVEDFERQREEEERREERRRSLAAAEREADRRRDALIAAANEAIRTRPAVPMPPRRLSERPYLRPVVDQSVTLQNAMAALSLDERDAERRREEERRREDRERNIRVRIDAEIDAQEEEAQRQRLRERQMPRRRFSVGPGHRRTRVVYDDGLYRWE